MRYTYKAAWSVVGGINLSKDALPVELFKSERCRFVLTNNPDILLADIDTGNAVGRLMLTSLIGQRNADFPTALEAAVMEIQAERAKKFGSHAVLVFEANGEVEAVINETSREHQEFIVTFDAVNKQEVARIHRNEIEAMKLAIAFESEASSKFATLGGDTYLTNEAGKLIYSISFSMSGEMTTGTVLSDKGVERISSRYGLLQGTNDMESVERLFSQMADHETDRLKAFLSGWTGLERLIAKTFKAYEHAFLSPLTNADQPTLRERFLDRIKDVMKDKYRLADKFVAVAAVLFPDAPNDEMQEDIKKFDQLKRLRDIISHGEEFSEKDLPIHELATLFRKYMLAYVMMLNTDEQK